MRVVFKNNSWYLAKLFGDQAILGTIEWRMNAYEQVA